MRPSTRITLPCSLTLSLLMPGLALGDVGTSGWTYRISFRDDGAPSTQPCLNPVFSADGRFVAFSTNEPMLPGDDNGNYDVYVYDLVNGDLICASVNIWGEYTSGSSSAPSLSADGRYVAFATTSPDLVFLDANNATDIIRMDLVTRVPKRVSQSQASNFASNGSCNYPAISADGRHVAFESRSDDLLPGDTNETWDIYVKDMDTGIVQRASMGNAGQPDRASFRPSISADGARVSFYSASDGLVAGDTDGLADVFVRDFDHGSTILVSRDHQGLAGNGPSSRSVLSDDGLRLVFRSAADLVVDDTNGGHDIYVAELDTGELRLLSRSLAGGPANSTSLDPSLSRNGRYAIFRSAATDITADSSGFGDIFVYDLDTDDVWLASRPEGASAVANGASHGRSGISDEGLVAFSSAATNLDPDDDGPVWDIFIRTMLADPTTYCDSMETADGCLPKLSTSGTPSATGDRPFSILAGNVPKDRAALLFYGFSGRRALPFMGGTHCVKFPVRRTRLLTSTSVADGPCGGLLAFDMNAFATGGLAGDPAVELTAVGQTVNCQFWGRDRNAPFGVFLTDAVEYVVGP